MKTLKVLSTFLISAALIGGCVSASDSDSEAAVQEDTYFSPPAEDADVIQSEKMDFIAQEVVSGLDGPWGAVFLPDGDVLITEKPGQLRRVSDGTLQEEPVSGVPEVWARGQGGLLDVALHPDYSDNGWIYLSYSKPGEGGAHTALMRAKLDGNALVDTEELFVGGPNTNRGQHFGGRIVFDPEGYLYLTIGDRGEMANAQDLTNYSGNVLRFNDDGSVPDDNPFVDDDEANDEIFTHGNRNPQGMAVHPETGNVWIHEHGPQGGDEINILESGANYGWPEITYGINYDNSVITEDTVAAGMKQPVHYWDPSIAPSGMAFLTGERYPDWEGNLFLGSLKFAYLDRVELDGNEVVHEERLLEGIGRVRDVIMAPDGYLYLLEETNGTLVRLVPVEE